MLSREQVEQYHRDGFVRGSRILTDAQVDELRAELKRVIADHEKPDVRQPVMLSNLGGNPAAPVWQIVNIWEASEPFAALTRNPTLLEEAAQLTGARELRVWHDQIQYKPASIGGVNMWHQDSPYWPILQPKDAQITCWVALDDVDADNGCMSMVPGSHRFGNTIEYLHTLKEFTGMPERYGEHSLEVRLCPVARGTVHFHHSLTWHGSHANTSGRPRRAVAVHFMTERTTYDPAGSHVMKQYVPAGLQAGEALQGGHFPCVWHPVAVS